MPGSQVVVEMDANEAKLWAAFQRIVQGEAQMETGMKKVSKATNDAAKEQRELERSAKRVLESIATPQDRYNAKITELNKLYGASKLTVDQFRAALTKVRNEYAALNDAATKNAQKTEDASVANAKAFGPEPLAAIGRYAAGILSLSAAIGIIKQGFTDMDAAREEAFNRAKGERAGLAQLAGLAQGPEQAQEYVNAAREAYKSGVGATPDEAAGLHYALISANLYDQRKVFEDLARSGVMSDVRPAVGAVAKIQAAMGVKETGDATALMSKLYQAADVTQYEAQDVAKAAAEPALFASKLGMSDEELIAQLVPAMAVLPANKVDSSARAYYQNLLVKGGYEGLSAEAQMAKVKKTLAPKSAEEQKKWFGSIEAQTFYETLMTEQGQKTFASEMAALPEAERTKLAVQKARLPDTDTELRRVRQAEESKRLREASERPEGAARALSEQILEDRMAYYKSRGEDWTAWWANKEARTERWLGGDEGVIRTAINDPRVREITREESQKYLDDPQMSEQTAVLKEISAKLDGGRTPRPMPAASSSANAANRD